MAKFILLYRGPATPPAEITPELGEKIMQQWGVWMGKVGGAIADLGAPFGGSTAIRGDGSTTNASDLTGYTVVEAADLEAAKGLCDGHPFLSDGTARFAVEVYELLPIPM
jgi:hypothetical protein